MIYFHCYFCFRAFLWLLFLPASGGKKSAWFFLYTVTESKVYTSLYIFGKPKIFFFHSYLCSSFYFCHPVKKKKFIYFYGVSAISVHVFFRSSILFCAARLILVRKKKVCIIFVQRHWKQTMHTTLLYAFTESKSFSSAVLFLHAFILLCSIFVIVKGKKKCSISYDVEEN